MNGEAIFLPMLSTMALTAVVWCYMYARRIPAMQAARIRVQTYTTPDTIDRHLAEDVNYPAYNLKNLCELPTVFYALCIYLFVSGNVDSIYLVLAWAFFAFRVLHSAVHCTANIVMLRFALYAAASLALWAMLLRALVTALVGG